MDRRELLKTKESIEENIIPYVSTHNSKNPEIYKHIINNIPILERDPKMSSIIQKHKIIKSKRQPPNLKKLLTRARFDERNIVPGIKKCGRSRCKFTKLCEIIIEGQHFTFKNGKHFTIKFNGSCDTMNIIYVIQCQGCKEEYIGETGNLRNRVNLHNQHIRNPDMAPLPVSRHISACARESQQKFHIFPLYKMNCNDVTLRRLKENYFIKLFKPKLNH